MKVILHIDMDSYFVSAARTVNPHLKGKPVVVTAGKRRSIVTAVSYEAKALGVKVPMPYYKAKDLSRDLVTIRPDFLLYTNLSRKIFELLSTKYTNKLEVASIDECYMDATELLKIYKTPINIAKHIQKTILTELKVPASVGIGPNKFVAKMSTKLKKPFGISVTKPGSFLEKFGNDPIETFFGIGKPTAKKLISMGIDTIGDLARADLYSVQRVLGKTARAYIDQANGHGSDELELNHNDLKSIGNSTTFQDRDRSNRKEILDKLSDMSQMVSHRAMNRNVVGYVISIGLKATGGREIKATRRQTTLSVPINSYEDIFKQVIKLFDELWRGETIKYVGVSLNNLKNMFDISFQTSLFDKTTDRTETQKILSQINKKFKSKVVLSAHESLKQEYKKQHQSKFIQDDRVVQVNLKHITK